MKKMVLSFHYICFITITAYCLLSTITAPRIYAKEHEPNIRYELALSFDLVKQQLNGTAYLNIPKQRGLTLFLDDIKPTGIMLKNASVAQADFSDENLDHISIPPANADQEVFLSFEKQVKEHQENFITGDGIVLLSNWFPAPSERVLFSLEAQIPKGFVALTESDILPPTASETVHFEFTQPTANIHFIAAPFIVQSRKVRDDLSVYSYFLTEDQYLAEGYLESACAFIQRYEEMIGKYPYDHFVIVENFRPTGYGMPTFTLLGKHVIRLPFIKDTSLGHEILHSWFGNSISVDYTQGNWSEGLTSYLADWLYREDVGEGALNRKEQLIKYHSYVTPENSIPLQLFTSAAHNQPMARAIRSVGYIKGAMLFHELRILIGDNLFFQGFRNFYAHFRHKIAGWTDIQKIFEAVSGEDLQRFFSERLQNNDIANLEIKDIEVTNASGNTLLNLTVSQKSEKPLQLTLPLRVESPNWSASFLSRISETTEKISIPLKSSPSRLVVDPAYDLMRTLEVSENVPTLGYFFGPRNPLVIADKPSLAGYSPFLEFSEKQKWPLVESQELQGSEINHEDLVLLGNENSIALSLFGPAGHPSSGMTIEARRHPLNENNFVLWVSAGSTDEIRKALPKLRHYGKYSYLHFEEGVLVEKHFSPETLGYTIPLTDEPTALPTKEVLSFDDTMEAILPARVVYLGESHTAMEDHHLQYLVLEKLFQEGQDLAIGMEMFPANSQDALDQYILGNSAMDEKTFLKRSGYFHVWKYDYRYYQDIINFARRHNIPLLGLNIDRDIVSSIFKNGSTEMLSEDQKNLLPRERDLSLPGYVNRLRAVHGLHPHGNKNQDGPGGFIQAQGVWDEVMAENIAQYLLHNPTKKMVVIAGAEHARKDNGIPPRVLRRIKVSQVVAMTVNENKAPSGELADYFFYIPPQELPPQGKIGISVEEKQKADETFLKIVTLSPESNASKTGLLPGDMIVSISGFPIETMEDIHIALAGKQAGENITIKVRKGTDKTAMEKMYNVKLYAPAVAQQQNRD